MQYATALQELLLLYCIWRELDGLIPHQSQDCLLQINIYLVGFSEVPQFSMHNILKPETLGLSALIMNIIVVTAVA